MRRLLLLMLALGLIGSVPAGAQEASDLLGGDFRISGPSATAWDIEPAVAWNEATGEYLVVWEDTRNLATRGRDIYGQRVSAGGARVGPEIRISDAAATSDEFDPAIAWNATADQYLVVWSDYRGGPTRGYDIYGQRVATNGSRVGSVVRISGTGATASESEPGVAWNGTAGQYLVVWEDTRNLATRSSDIYGRRIGPTGVGVGNDFRVSGVNATAGEYVPSVACNASANQCLVVWQDERNQATRGDDIYGRRVSDTGSLSTELRVSGPNAVTYDYAPAVAASASSEYLVVWSDGRNVAGRHFDIWGRRVGTTGTFVGPDFRVVGPSAIGADYDPAVTWNANDSQYLVVWEDHRTFTSNPDIWSRRVGLSGFPGGDMKISGPGSVGGEYAPAVAWNAANDQYLIVWEDYRNSSTRQTDIYGRRMS